MSTRSSNSSPIPSEEIISISVEYGEGTWEAEIGGPVREIDLTRDPLEENPPQFAASPSGFSPLLGATIHTATRAPLGEYSVHSAQPLAGPPSTTVRGMPAVSSDQPLDKPGEGEPPIRVSSSLGGAADVSSDSTASMQDLSESELRSFSPLNFAPSSGSAFRPFARPKATPTLPVETDQPQHLVLPPGLPLPKAPSASLMPKMQEAFAVAQERGGAPTSSSSADMVSITAEDVPQQANQPPSTAIVKPAYNSLEHVWRLLCAINRGEVYISFASEMYLALEPELEENIKVIPNPQDKETAERELRNFKDAKVKNPEIKMGDTDCRTHTYKENSITITIKIRKDLQPDRIAAIMHDLRETLRSAKKRYKLMDNKEKEKHETDIKKTRAAIHAIKSIFPEVKQSRALTPTHRSL